MLYGEVKKLTDHIAKYIKGIYLTGSMCRNENIINDIDYITKRPVKDVIKDFQQLYDIVLLKAGEQHGSIILETDDFHIQVDIWRANDDYHYKFLKWMRKLDKGHSIYLRKLARDKGLVLSDKGLRDDDLYLNFRTFPELKKFLLE